MQLLILKSLVGENEDDQVLKNFLESSKRLIEGYLGYRTDYGTYTVTSKPGVIYLPYAPVHTFHYIRDVDGNDITPDVVNASKGIIIIEHDKDIEVKFTAGIVDNENFDIAVALMASYLYNRRSSIGVHSERIGNYVVTYTEGIPSPVLSLLSGLKRI